MNWGLTSWRTPMLEKTQENMVIIKLNVSQRHDLAAKNVSSTLHYEGRSRQEMGACFCPPMLSTC